uniref:Ankyrin repeat domain-containing protein n=1 Tax=Timema douglasi TaxID=61478 RepID=A0A7R8VL15_TIMDO|nr:unnamed protein product [Timema douglasi]
MIRVNQGKGNTALHLAVMLGRKECVHLLLAHGAPVKVKNLAGWSPLAEAISYGDRQTILSLVRKLKQQAREQMEERRPNLVAALNQMGDFYMELKWDFQSWVPLVSRILPSDICHIHKRGSSIRLDTTLVDFNDMHWERGDISFLFTGDRKPSQSLTVLDNKAQLFQRVRYEETETEIEDEVDILMSSDIMAAQMSTKSITFTRAQTGWIFREDRKVCTTSSVSFLVSRTSRTFVSDLGGRSFFSLSSRMRNHLGKNTLNTPEQDSNHDLPVIGSIRCKSSASDHADTKVPQTKAPHNACRAVKLQHDKREMVGPFQSDFYVINGMLLESRKRREHLSEEDLQKNKAIMESLTKGSTQGFDNNGEPVRRSSLTPPPDNQISWLEYMSSEAGSYPNLGRNLVYKETNKAFKATVAMSPDFPLSVDMLLNVLEVITPFKHFSKLREFVQMKLPPGFPVKIDIPILPTVTAKITFQEFAFRNDVKPELFEIPKNYVEDPTRFVKDWFT